MTCRWCVNWKFPEDYHRKAQSGLVRGHCVLNPVWIETSEWPGRKQYVGLESFLSDDAPLLSTRAAAGFLSRLERSKLHVPEEFLNDLRAFVRSRRDDGSLDKPADGAEDGKDG